VWWGWGVEGAVCYKNEIRVIRTIFPFRFVNVSQATLKNLLFSPPFSEACKKQPAIKLF